MDEQKSEKKFVDGMRFFKARDNAPSYVKGRISIEPNKLIAFLKANKEHMVNGYFGIDMKLSSKEGGGIYFELDTYKPKPKVEEADPFADVFDDLSGGAVDPSEIPF